MHDATQREDRESEVIVSVALSENLAKGNVREPAAEVTQAASSAIGVARVSVWLFEDDERRLVNMDIYDATTGEHSCGSVLLEQEYADEFTALKNSTYVDADDPLTDPRTAGYVEGYLKPNRITSMLDAAIRRGGNTLGTLCFEHVDQPHHWREDEIAFACRLADQLALALSNREHKVAEEKVRANEALFRDLADSLDDLYFALDRDFRYLYWNDACCRMFDVSTNTLLGTSWFDFEPNRGYEWLADAYREVMRTGVSQVINAEFLSPDGPFDFEIKVYPTELGCAVVLRDVTERKRSERALAESEERFRGFAAAAREGICVHRRGLVLDVNSAFCEIFGYPAEEFIGNDPTDMILTPESAAKTRKNAAAGLENSYDVVGDRSLGWLFDAPS